MPKPCSYPGCKYPQFGGGYCRMHQYKRTDKKPATINQYSEKRQRINDELYYPARNRFLAGRPKCEIQSPECTENSECVHHTRGRGIYLLDEETWMAACKRCNNYIEANTAWAQENGFIKSKHTKN